MGIGLGIGLGMGMGRQRSSELAGVGELATLPKRTLAALDAAADVVSVDAGTTLWGAGSSVRWVAIVLEGTVVEAGGHGRGRGAGVQSPFVGLAEAIGHRAAADGVVATTPARIAFIGVRELTALAARHGDFAQVLLRHLAGDALAGARRARRAARPIELRRVPLTELSWAS